jgi:hypothetical protein
MTTAHGLVQPGWGMAPNRGWHTASPDDPMQRHRGPRAPSIGMSVSRGMGIGAAPTHDSVVRPKVAVVVEM